jgi:hypothetical protein
MLGAELASRPCPSRDAAVLEDVPEDVPKLAGGSCRGGGNRMAYLRLFANLKQHAP